MPATKAIRHLLIGNAALLVVVPAARIVVGDIPLGTTMPAISILGISNRSMKMVGNSGTHLWTARVQITIMNLKSTAGGSDVPGMSAILALIKTALPTSRGTANGVAVDSVLHENDGGPFSHPLDDDLLLQPIDYFVNYNA